MSLFEKLKNKRYDLQEKKEKFDPAAELLKAIKKRSERDAARDFQKDIGKDITPELKADQNRFFTDKSDSDTLKTKSTGDEGQFRRNAKKQQPLISKDIKKAIPRKSKKITTGALQARDRAISAFDQKQLMITAKPGEAAKTKRLISKKVKNITAPKEGEVEKAKKIVKKINTKAQDYTDKINQQNKNRPEGKKRQYYKGRKAEKAVYTDGLSREQRVANIKRDTALQDIQKTKNYQAGAKKRKATNLRKIEKKFSDKISQKVQLKKMRPQRQFYKGALGTTQNIVKVFGGKSAKVAPAVKTGLKGITKAGPAGAIAGGTALALLNPSIRKTAKKVAKAALGAAGIKAFTSKPKAVKKPPSSIGINLSPAGSSSNSPSKFALKRQELLKKDPSKVANKNLA